MNTCNRSVKSFEILKKKLAGPGRARTRSSLVAEQQIAQYCSPQTVHKTSHRGQNRPILGTAKIEKNKNKNVWCLRLLILGWVGGLEASFQVFFRDFFYKWLIEEATPT